MEKSKKSKKDKSDKKSSKSDKQVSVKTSDELKACIQSKTPFRFDDPTFVLAFHELVTVPKKRIIEALKYDTTIAHLILAPMDKKEMKSLVECLTRFNRGIKKISLRQRNFDAYSMDSVIAILKANQHIKSLEITQRSPSTEDFSVEGLKQFCSNMDQFNFEELILNCFSLPQDYFELFLDSLKNNHSIQSINLTHVFLEGKLYSRLCEVLIYSKIKEFYQWGYHNEPDQIQFAENYEAFRRVLRANHLTKLTLRGTLIRDMGDISPVDNIGLVSEDLKKNTSITDLTIQTHNLDWKTFGEIINSNKSIKRLHLRDISISGTEISHLNLANNTTITDLALTSGTELKYLILLAELCNNNTLRRLEVASSTILPRDLLEKYLKENRSLRDLKIDVGYGYLPSKTISTIFTAIADSKIFRKLSVQIPRIEFNDLLMVTEALKRNEGLQELHIGNMKNIRIDFCPPNGGSFDDYLLDVLKTNKSLRYITGAEALPHIEERLIENRKVQEQSISDTRTAIRMIVARPKSFVLPMEIWFHIFKFVSYPFDDFDFAKYLLALNK